MPNKISKESRFASAVGIGMIIGCKSWIERKAVNPQNKFNLTELTAHMKQVLHDMVSKDATVALMVDFDAICRGFMDSPEQKKLLRNFLYTLLENVKANLADVDKFFVDFDLANLPQSLTITQQGRLKQILQLSLSYVIAMEKFWSKDWHSAQLAAYITTMELDYSPEYTQKLLWPMLKLYRDRDTFAPICLPYVLKTDIKELFIGLLNISGPRNILFEDIIEKTADIEELSEVYINNFKLDSKHYHIVMQVLGILRSHEIRISRIQIELADDPQHINDFEMLASIKAFMKCMPHVTNNFITIADMPLVEFALPTWQKLLHGYDTRLKMQAKALNCKLPLPHTKAMQNNDQEDIEILPSDTTASVRSSYANLAI